MRTPVKAVFFDAGHTLIESMPDVVGIYCRAAQHFGVTIDPRHTGEVLSTLWGVYGRTTAAVARTAVTDEADREMWRSITRHVFEALPELHTLDYDAWFEHLHDIFIDPDTWQPYAETVEVLQALKAMNVRTAVISNWSSNLPHILDDKGLTPYFDAILVSCIEGIRKPDAEIFHRALERIGVEPGQAIHVGDSYEDDVVGARDAGIWGVWLNRGASRGKDCTTIADLRGVLDLIAQTQDLPPDTRDAVTP